jgi:hypothetical protein
MFSELHQAYSTWIVVFNIISEREREIELRVIIHAFITTSLSNPGFGQQSKSTDLSAIGCRYPWLRQITTTFQYQQLAEAHLVDCTV